MPVFYGTDRDHEENPKRLAYNADRAHGLELGRALVTVPKSHQVPQVERPWAIRIPYFNVTIYEQAEDPKKHFTLQEIRSLTKSDFLRLVRARLASSNTFKNHAIVFVHGYNTSFDNALYRTAQIAYDLHFDGARSSTAGRRAEAWQAIRMTARAPKGPSPTCGNSSISS